MEGQNQGLEGCQDCVSHSFSPYVHAFISQQVFMEAPPLTGTFLEAGDTVMNKQIQSLSLCSWVQAVEEGTSTLLGLAPHHSATIMSEWHC